MPLYYLETSALVKLYILEAGSDRLLRIAKNLENRLAILSLSPVEVRSAIRRRERAGDIDSKVAALVLDQMTQHLTARFIQQDLDTKVLAVSFDLIDRYALRAYDAVQLAGCITFIREADPQPVTLVCSDIALLEAARSESLIILDPCSSI